MSNDIISSEQNPGNNNAGNSYIDDIIAVMNNTTSAMQLSDLTALDNFIRQARRIYTAAEKNADPDLVLVKIIQLVILLLASYAQMNVYQLEARFKEALDEADEIINLSRQALDALNTISNADAEDASFSLIRQILEYYNTLGPGSKAYVTADQLVYKGDFEEYRKALLDASALFKKVELLSDSDNAIVLQLYASASNTAERLANRARYFEFIQRDKTNQYINPEGKKVFIIHGHSDIAAASLQDILKDEFELDSVILKNEASGGDSVIEKFESFARDCGYSFAIITSDDEISAGGEKYLQARPNVLFELGWFYGRYGRKRVCILKQKGTHIPSDIEGIISLEFNNKIDETFLEMKRELKAAGLVKQKI